MDNKSGFSLLEILIVVLIIGLLSSMIAPNFQRATPRYEREAFIARFNTVVQFGWQQALITHKLHRVTVDIGKSLITLMADSGEKDKSGEAVFKLITNAVEDITCPIPDQILIKQFFIEGYDMMTKHGRSGTKSAWFYIVPDGIVQNVVINCNDTKDTQDNKSRPVGLVMNPFSAQFKVYDAFQKP
jgi:prepilin-type N-terminal cleavage/methylation domain-containing protein